MVAMKPRHVIRIGLFALIGSFLLIQAIPYGRDHANPPRDGRPRDAEKERLIAGLEATFPREPADRRRWSRRWGWRTGPGLTGVTLTA
jgi:hypothetical protein